MSSTYFLTTICLVIQLLGAGSAQVCNSTEEGITWAFDVAIDEEINGVPTESACLELCSGDDACKGYTWTYASVINNCYLFKQLTGIQECQNCVSGVLPEDLEGSCVGGADAIIAVKSAESVIECKNLCSETTGCKAVTFWDESSIHTNTCFMYGDCENQLPCDGCVSSRTNCILPNQCYVFQVLNEADRSTSNENGDCLNGKCFCDQKDSEFTTSVGWQGADYYRFMEPAGSMMTESSVGGFRCGTGSTGYLNGQHPEELGEEKYMTACFDSASLNDCKYKEDVTVTRCNNYYVYHLYDTPECISRYCAENSN